MGHKNRINVNEDAIMKALKAGDKSRGEIIEVTHQKWTTCYDSLKRLMISGKVNKKTLKKGRGRPITLFYLEN